MNYLDQPRSKTFAVKTCEALADWLLQQEYTFDCDANSPTLAEAGWIVDLSSQDESFGKWYRERISNDQPTVSQLLAALVEDTGWLGVEASSKRLWNLANLCIRLTTLQSRFASELSSAKREALYHVAYGLSHELNNPLANITTRAGVLKQAELSEDQQLMLDTIIENAMRGHEMLGDLMLVARPPKIHPQPIELASWVKDFSEKAALWCAARQVGWTCCNETVVRWNHFDPVAIKEALWCLVRNAIEVSNPGETVSLVLRENSREIRENSQSEIDVSEKQIAFEVTDQGPGLTLQSLQHAFDPYYSGREAGRGLGMGLFKARRLAELHSGRIELQNHAGGGCVATLWLPILNKTSDAQ